MNEKLTNDFVNNINELPPLIKYPALLLLCDIIYEVLPQAEQEYHEEQRAITDKFIEVMTKLHPERGEDINYD